jgi:hypothetical protein
VERVAEFGRPAILLAVDYSTGAKILTQPSFLDTWIESAFASDELDIEKVTKPSQIYGFLPFFDGLT